MRTSVSKLFQRKMSTSELTILLTVMFGVSSGRPNWSCNVAYHNSDSAWTACTELVCCPIPLVNVNSVNFVELCACKFRFQPG